MFQRNPQTLSIDKIFPAAAIMTVNTKTFNDKAFVLQTYMHICVVIFSPDVLIFRGEWGKWDIPAYRIGKMVKKKKKDLKLYKYTCSS